MRPSSDDDLSSLERARRLLYGHATPRAEEAVPEGPEAHDVPHVWDDEKQPLPHPAVVRGKKHVRMASIFLGVSVLFFLVALSIVAYLFYFGGNSVSPSKIDITIEGPTTIAAGDVVPLSLTVVNRNPVAIKDAIVEIDFPSGTRSAADKQSAYPRYVENLGTIPSGGLVTRSVKAVVFGGAGQTLSLPASLTFGTANSNATFVKKSSYALAISSTPLSVSVDTLAETVSGQPLTFALTVRSNATVPLDNVVLKTAFPFGFQVASSSLPIADSNMYLGTLQPGASKDITLTGTLVGQDKEQRVFHFTVGTAVSAQNQALAVTYMTQDATVLISAPFINTSLTLNGTDASTAVLQPGSNQNATLSYTNTLATTVTNATIRVTLGGSGIDLGSIQTKDGFYDSATHSIVFSKDTDPALASLAPGASGIGTFSFSTASSGTFAPEVTFSTTVSGSRVGQTNVPQQVSSSGEQTVKVSTNATIAARASRTAGPWALTGPVPPKANQATQYAIVLDVRTAGSSVAGATVTATLPSYVTYVGKTAGAGTVSYDPASRTVTWDAGDLPQGGSAEGLFLVSIVPSTSQKGSAPQLTSAPTFSGYDRFAGVQLSSTAAAPTTATTGDPGYVAANGTVQ